MRYLFLTLVSEFGEQIQPNICCHSSCCMECFVAPLSSVPRVLYSFVRYVFSLSITLLPDGCLLPFYHQVCWWWILSALYIWISLCFTFDFLKYVFSVYRILGWQGFFVHLELFPDVFSHFRFLGVHEHKDAYTDELRKLGIAII